GKVIVRGMDTLTTKQFEIDADLVVLGSGLVAQPDAVRVAQMLNIPYDKNRFFTEAHPKLRPVEVVSSGVFLTGACQAPKDIPDSVATASAASVKVCGLFANDYLTSNPMVAMVDVDKCTGCFSCISVCPYKAISKSEVLMAKPDVKRPVAEVNEVLCQGCGTCTAICRNAAVDLKGFADEQLHDQIESFTFSEEEVTG
ncbi:MAG: 4Fe-4S binding protein, partial [bacterium]